MCSAQCFISSHVLPIKHLPKTASFSLVAPINLLGAFCGPILEEFLTSEEKRRGDKEDGRPLGDGRKQHQQRRESIQTRKGPGIND
jgi:hypothetical protein